MVVDARIKKNGCKVVDNPKNKKAKTRKYILSFVFVINFIE